MANDVDPFVKNWMNNLVTKGRLNSNRLFNGRKNYKIKV
jgi:hypothetical protein